jgi:hypothetical protein
MSLILHKYCQNKRHDQNGFRVRKKGAYGVDLWKKLKVNNLVTLFL